MRSLLFLAAVVVTSGWIAIQHLPEGKAVAETVVSSRPQEVQSVALDGKSLPMAALRAVLTTHTGDLIDASKLEHDRAALEDMMVARGYLDAQVRPAHVMFDAGGGAFVMFAIDSGREYHVRSVKITGASEKDAGIVTIGKGQLAAADRLARARDAIADRLVARGAKATAVTTRLHADAREAVVDVEFTVN